MIGVRRSRTCRSATTGRAVSIKSAESSGYAYDCGDEGGDGMMVMMMVMVLVMVW